jgi:hypothetical protein
LQSCGGGVRGTSRGRPWLSLAPEKTTFGSRDAGSDGNSTSDRTEFRSHSLMCSELEEDSGQKSKRWPSGENCSFPSSSPAFSRRRALAGKKTKPRPKQIHQARTRVIHLFTFGVLREPRESGRLRAGIISFRVLFVQHCDARLAGGTPDRGSGGARDGSGGVAALNRRLISGTPVRGSFARAMAGG